MFPSKSFFFFFFFFFFFDVSMYEREVRSPTQYRIAVVGTFRCHYQKKGGKEEKEKKNIDNTKHDCFFPP